MVRYSAVIATAVPTDVLGLVQLVVKGRMAEAGLIDVAMAAEVILDRVDAAQRTLAGDRAVIVRDRHIQTQAPGMAGDGLAQDVSPSISQGRRDPQHLVLIVLAGSTDDLDHVGLAQRQGSRLVEGQGAEPADLLEECSPLISTPHRAAAARPLTTATGVAMTRRTGRR